MSMVFHFFKKDVRRNAWLFCLWFSLFVLEGIWTLTKRPPEIDGAGLAWFSALNPLLFQLINLLVLAVLVQQLIQEDAATGSTAFWQTRPVGRGALLLAKLAGLGLVVLIPLLVGSGVLLVFGISACEWGWSAMEILLRQLYFLVPLALLAAVTSSFARFVIVTVTLALGLVLASLLPVPFPAPFASVELDSTRYLIVTLLLIVGGGLLLAHQYLTRRSKRSIILALGLLGICMAVGSFWSINLVRAMPVHSSRAAFDPTKVTVQIIPGSLNNSPYTLPSGSLGKNIDGPYIPSGVPPGFLVRVRSVAPRLSTPEGAKIATLGVVGTVPSYSFDPPAAPAISAAIGDIPVESSMLGSASTTFVTIDHATFLRHKDSPARLVANMDLVVSRYERETEMPLVAGSRYDQGGLHVRIDGLVPTVNGIAIMVSESFLNLRFGGVVHGANQLTDPRQQGDPVYLLVNRALREAALVGNDGVSSARSAYFDGMVVQQSLKLPFARKGTSRAPIIDQQWLAGAVLVRLERVPVAEFSRTAEVELQKLGEPWLSVRAQERKANARMPEPLSKGQSTSGTTVDINKDGIVSLDGKAVTEEELKALLVRTHAVDADASVVIISEEETELIKVTLVMDACRAAGLQKIRLRSR